VGSIGSLLKKAGLTVSLWLLSFSVYLQGSVFLDVGFIVRDDSGAIATPGTMWALVVANPSSSLPGELTKNSSLTLGNKAAARADFAGKEIATGSKIGTAMIVATGQVDNNNSILATINWTDQDYMAIQAGGLIGLYWFPGITGSTTVLPENNFQIGGLQETIVDVGSGGDAGMIVPTNSGQNFTIAYFDNVVTAGESRLPPSRFTAIDIPPSGYQIWRDSHFTSNQITAGDASSDADPDGDGLINLLEYATGHPPLLSSAAPLTLTRVDASSALLQFDQIADPELHYRVEATEDLALTPWPDVVFESSGAENVAERIERSQPFTSGQRFFRLQVDFVP
jgi:hypothetical protein